MNEAKSVQTILESQYTDGIDTILSYELDDKDNIVGQFRDGQKIYAFRVNSDEIAYKLINQKAVANFLESEVSDDPADLYTEQAIALAAPIFSEWLENLENHIFDGVTDLGEVRDRLDSAFSEMDSKDFAALMQETMFASYGAGCYQVQQETTDDTDFEEDNE